MINWKNIKYFKSSEFDDSNFPGSGENIDGVLLLQLARLRINTDWPMIITSAVDMDGSHGHAKNSYHLFKNGCKAADFVFKTEVSVREQAYAVLREGFGGIGLYLDLWGYPIGFHVDIRPKKEFQMWTCRITGNYVYVL